MKTIGLKEYEEITKIANLYLEGCKKAKVL